MDDWSALELECEDENLESLFRGGATRPKPFGSGAPSPQTSHGSVLQASSIFPQRISLPAGPALPRHASGQKRNADQLELSSSGGARRPSNFFTDTSYDELELEPLTAANALYNHNQRQQAVPDVSRAAPSQLHSQHPGISASGNTSQTTEQWLGLPAPLQTQSQQWRAARPPPCRIPVTTHRISIQQPETMLSDEEILPGPAGVLQKAQANGMQMPDLASLTGQSQQSASQWQLQQHSFHPDFLSPAWQSAMDALDLPAFDESSLLLQHHVKSIMLCPSSSKLPKVILLIESLTFTGCGDAFAHLKDPTGSIGAGLHSDIFQAEGGVSPGAVLMLEEVPLLVLSRTTKYLSITARNILQVINCN